MHRPDTSLLLSIPIVLLLTGSSFSSQGPATNLRLDPPGTGTSGPGMGPEMAQTGLGGAPMWTVTDTGADFVQASATTRTAGLLATQTCPFALALPALPPGAIVLESFAAWNYLTDSAPAFDTININGNAVQGSLVGAGTGDLCWGENGAAAYVASGLTAILNLGGNNLIGGACDKPLGGDPSALGEGITLLVVYAMPHGAKRTVSVWSGYTSTESSASGDADAIFVLPQPYSGGPAHFFLNALDGQLTAAGDNFLFNGFAASGVLAGTSVAGNAWIGLLGPLAHSNLYDAVEDDVSAMIAIGDMTLQTRSVKIADCIGHSFAAFAQDDSCANVVSYCTAKVNSQGCTPSLSATGTPSAGAGVGSFDITASSLINNKPGVLIYGYGPAAIPFQNGFLCIQPPVTRSSVKNSGGNPPPDDCSGGLSFDFNVAIQSGGDPGLVAGATVFTQVWSRDVADPVGTNLTDALCFDICP